MSSSVRSLVVVVVVALACACRSADTPRFVPWEPAGGWLAAQVDASHEVRASIDVTQGPDARVLVEVERTPPRGITDSALVPANDEGGHWSARVPAGAASDVTKYRWVVQSASRTTVSGEPVVYGTSEWRLLMTVDADRPKFTVLAPANGASGVGQPIPGDLDHVTVLFQFHSDAAPGELVDYIVRVENEAHAIEWFDRPQSGGTERALVLRRGETFRCVAYGVHPRPMSNAGGSGGSTYRVYVRGDERTITTRP
ncbi:MAG: hypothetical protein ACKVWV_01010 [Planctomycetota bacterium]